MTNFPASERKQLTIERAMDRNGVCRRKPGVIGVLEIREIWDLNQEQGVSEYYEEEKGWEWSDSYCPRRLANEMRMRGAVGFGLVARGFVPLAWLMAVPEAADCASWHAGLKEVDERLRFGEDMRGILKQDFM